MWKSIDSTASVVAIVNRAVPYYVAGVAVAIGFIMRLFNIGVDGQHQLAALFAAAFGFGIGSWGLPAPLYVLSIFLVAVLVAMVWAAIAAVLKVDPQRQRGDLDDHAQLHRQPADLLPAARALGPGRRDGRRDRPAARRRHEFRTSTACSRRSGSTSRPTSCSRASCRSPSSSGSPTTSCSTAAASASTSGSPVRTRRPPRRPASTRSGWSC